MRNIKFRVWDSERKSMYYLLNNKYSFGTCEADRAVSWEDVFAEQYQELTPLQYTGLKDNKGKMIYEGDIIQVNLKIKTKQSSFLGKVVWNYRLCHYDLIQYLNDGIQTDFFNVAYCKECEVVGNIYENPKLLEKELC